RGAHAFGEGPPLRVGVDADDGAALGGQQLYREQTDQPEPGHDKSLADGGGGEPDPLKGDAADGGEGGVGGLDPLGYGDREVGVGHRQLAVRRGCGDPVTDCYVGDVLPDFDDPAGQRVAEGDRLVQLVADG